MAVGNNGSPGAVTIINGDLPPGTNVGNRNSPFGVVIHNSDSSFLNGPPSWAIEAGNNGGGSYVDNRSGVINRSVNAGSIAPGAVVTTGNGNTIVGFSRSGETGANAPTLSPTPSPTSPTSPTPSTPVQGNAGWVGAVTQSAGQAFSYMAQGTLENAGRAAGAFAKGFQQSFGQQGSMGATPTPAYQGRTQPAAANPQQSGYSQRQAAQPVAGQGKFSDKFAGVAALSAIGTTMVVGAAAAAPLVLAAAPAVAMAYMAIKTAEALMKFFSGDRQGQQAASQQQQQPARQPQEPSGQQQQQQQVGNRAGRTHTFMGDVDLNSPNPTYTYPTFSGDALQESLRRINERSLAAMQEEDKANKRAASDGQQAPAQGEQVTMGNANGGTTGIEFTQDVNLGGVQAPSAPGFNMDTVNQALAAARGSR